LFARLSLIAGIPCFRRPARILFDMFPAHMLFGFPLEGKAKCFFALTPAGIVPASRMQP